MVSKSFRWIFTGLIVGSAFAPWALATQEDDYPGTNAVTTEVDTYRPTPATVSAGVDLEFSPVSYDNYVWKDGHTDPKSGYGVRLAVEWIPFPERYGKISVGFGVGLYDVSKIALAGGSYGELQALPIDPYIGYRLDYFRHQILVPFVKVGPEMTILRDRTMAGNQTYWGMNYTVGLELCLDRIDKSSAHALEHDFGIKHSYLIGEFMRDRYLGRDEGPDLTRDEWRFGFRFEI